MSIARIAGLVIGAMLTQPTMAQVYPSRPIRLVVPFPPGGSADLIARILAQEMSRGFGQNVLIDNRPGASAIVGHEHVAKSAPDGYTLLMGNVGAMAIHPFTYAKLPYDPIRDLAPVTLLATITSVVAVHPSLPARDIRELVALAKRHPGKLNFTSSGAGSSPHLAGEFLKQRAGIDMQHISYKGSGPALIDLIGGKIDLMFENLPSAMAHLQGGRIRAIAVTSAKRSPALPQVPAIEESGFPGFDVLSWQAVVAPAATPKDIIARLHAEIARDMTTQPMRTRFTELGADVIANTPEQFAAYLRDEQARWSRVVKQAGIRLE